MTVFRDPQITYITATLSLFFNNTLTGNNLRQRLQEFSAITVARCNCFQSKYNSASTTIMYVKFWFWKDIYIYIHIDLYMFQNYVMSKITFDLGFGIFPLCRPGRLTLEIYGINLQLHYVKNYFKIGCWYLVTITARQNYVLNCPNM